MTTNCGPGTIGFRLAQVADRLPDKIAIAEREAGLSYGLLQASSTAIARRIVATANDRPGLVCLLFESRIPAIKAIFGASRCGRAYVPLDAGDPDDRLRFILQDSEPVALLTEGHLLARARTLAPAGCAIIDTEHIDKVDETLVLPDVSCDAPAYLFYTSGSTGQPKGVSQTQRNLLFFVDAYAKTLHLVEADRLSLLYSLSFSAANMDIFGGLLNGATLCAYDLRRDGIPLLADWLDREQITVLHAVPTVFRELMNRLAPERQLLHLRAIDLGGESVFDSDVELFVRHTPTNCVLINHLAATEASVIAQHVVGHRNPRAPGAVLPVGRCPVGVSALIRREDGSEADVNEIGEIVVSSPHVSPGYWRRPELNASAFSPDPLAPGWRRYSSGDLGRIDERGKLHFLGRKGSRVKIRGHSVDVTEVEAALCACPGVTKAAVLASGDALQGQSQRLDAYVAIGEDGERDPLAIRRHLATRLPSYMLPTRYLILDALPQTATGKIDRQGLCAMQPPRADAARDGEPPRDDVEQTVAAIFQQLLGHTPIQRGDDFFLLGGDSLSVVELQVLLRDVCGVNVTNFHQEATVAGIAACVRRLRVAGLAGEAAMPLLVPLRKTGHAPPLFLVHGRLGQAFVSPHFLALLGDDQPVWAFQARGLDGLQEPHATIEQMAVEYVRQMRRLRPEGPYFLGALCAGALVAVVMARLLAEAGESVLPLLLLDPPERPFAMAQLRMTEQELLARLKLRRALGRIDAPLDDSRYADASVRVATAFEHAIRRHQPQPYDGPVYMLSSGDRPLSAEPSAAQQIFVGKVERFEVATTHNQLLDARSPAFASGLARCLGLIREAAKVC